MNERETIIAILKAQILIEQAHIKAESGFVLNTDLQIKCNNRRKAIDTMHAQIIELKK